MAKFTSNYDELVNKYKEELLNDEEFMEEFEERFEERLAARSRNSSEDQLIGL